MKPSVPYKPHLLKELRDPREAVAYLQDALEDEDPRVFLIALRDVVQAQCGMAKLARNALLSREHLYDLLSERGNPAFQTLRTLLLALGFQLTLTVPKKLKEAA